MSMIDLDTGEILPTFFRTGYNYDRDQASRQAGTRNTQPSLTQQQFKEEADINTIVRRFGLTGQLPDNPRVPSYGDFTQVTDYQTALNAVRSAEEAFMALPAAVRAEFANDPQKLLTAVEDPSQRDKLRELGLLNPEKLSAEGSTSGTRSPSEQSPPSPPPADETAGK